MSTPFTFSAEYNINVNKISCNIIIIMLSPEDSLNI